MKNNKIFKKYELHNLSNLLIKNHKNPKKIYKNKIYEIIKYNKNKKIEYHCISICTGDLSLPKRNGYYMDDIIMIESEDYTEEIGWLLSPDNGFLIFEMENESIEEIKEEYPEYFV